MGLENLTNYEKPIIGVIGAAVPLPQYDEKEARKLGYELRKLVERRGTLFTGGVPGIGFDFYQGIVDYSIEKNVSDKFFVLFPEGQMGPPEEYFELAKKTKNCILRIEKAGKDMEERRTHLARIADALIIINGAEGTIDEALKGLLLRKQLLCLQNSGGAAEVIAKLKKGEIERIPLEIDYDLIRLHNSTEEIVNYLSNSNFYKSYTEDK